MDGDEENESSLGSKKPPSATSKLTLEKAVELGEYEPDFLANFAEWHSLSRHLQFEYVRRALDNRRRQLLTQYAELNNVLDYSKKPEVHQAVKNMEKQLSQLLKDKERLYAEYSS